MKVLKYNEWKLYENNSSSGNFKPIQQDPEVVYKNFFEEFKSAVKDEFSENDQYILDSEPEYSYNEVNFDIIHKDVLWRFIITPTNEDVKIDTMKTIRVEVRGFDVNDNDLLVHKMPVDIEVNSFKIEDVKHIIDICINAYNDKKTNLKDNIIVTRR